MGHMCIFLFFCFFLPGRVFWGCSLFFFEGDGGGNPSGPGVGAGRLCYLFCFGVVLLGVGRLFSICWMGFGPGLRWAQGSFSGTHHKFRVPGHGAGVANTSPPTYNSLRDSFLGHWPSGRGEAYSPLEMYGVAAA